MDCCRQGRFAPAHPMSSARMTWRGQPFGRRSRESAQYQPTRDRKSCLFNEITALCRRPVEPEQQAVVAVPWRIDGLLIDQNGVDHAAHLDELLPIPAVASEARDLAGANRTNLTEANLRYHPLKASALYPAGG